MAIPIACRFTKRILNFHWPCLKIKCMSTHSDLHKSFIHNGNWNINNYFRLMEHSMLSMGKSSQEAHGIIHCSTSFCCERFSQAVNSTTRPKKSINECAHITKLCRCLSKTVPVKNHSGLGRTGLGQGGENKLHRSSVKESDWGLRLAAENGYLSWCRNTYLSTVVALAMLAEGTTVLAQQAAEGAFFVAALNLSWGTFQFIHNILHLRQAIGMTIFGMLCYVCLALLHLIMWLMVCTLFLGYTEDPDMKALEEEAARQSKKE